MWPGLGEISTFFQREGKVLASQNALGNLRELRLAIQYTKFILIILIILHLKVISNNATLS